MKRLIKLVFGDVRNVASVAVALIAAYGASRWQPDLAGWLLVVVVLGATVWQAA